MHVQAAKPRDVEHGLGNDQAVGDHHQGIQIQVAQLLANGLALEVFRLQYVYVMGQSELFHRTHLDLLAAAGSAVRLGEYGYHFMRAVEYGLQAGGGEIRGAGEGET